MNERENIDQSSLSDDNKSEPAVFRPTSGTPRLSDIAKFEADLPIPENGPWADFTKMAIEAGYPKDHANAVWSFTANFFLTPSTTYDFFGDLTRLSPAVILAGDEAVQNCNLRKLVYRALPNKEIYTSIETAKSLKDLEESTLENSRTIISHDRELALKKWRSSPKSEITTEELLDQFRFNLILKDLGRTSPLPAGVSILAGHPLSCLTNLDPCSNTIFSQTLIVPSFGTHKIPVPEALEQRSLCLNLSALRCLNTKEEVTLRLSTQAKKSWLSAIEEQKNEIEKRINLSSEMSSWRLRMVAFLPNIIGIAVSHAANRDMNNQSKFNEELQDEDIIFATSYMRSLHFAWETLESICAKTKSIEIAETYHSRICSDFSEKYIPNVNGIVVKLTELVARYCQHPKRDGQYTSREFEFRIMEELRRNGLAQPHPNLPKHWIIFS
ncbi:MAG: hypothetical protein ACSHYA_11915 [Opitutaceae bacterium]